MVCFANLLCNALEQEHAFKYLPLVEGTCHLGPNFQFLVVRRQNLLINICNGNILQIVSEHLGGFMVCNSMPLDGSYDGSAVSLTEIGVTYAGSHNIKTGTRHLVILGQQG